MLLNKDSHLSNCCCTIVTEDYLPYALALYESLKLNSSAPFSFYVLVSSERPTGIALTRKQQGIDFVFVEELCVKGIAKRIKDKYFHSYIDGFRWSMKPVFINYLMQERNFDKVIFLDCDLFFFSDYRFLLDRLDTVDVILTPHWRSSDPYADPVNFQQQYNRGLYNGGFIAVNRKATPIMDWWATACEYVCTIAPSKGYYVDQTHLNLFPVFFDNVEIIKHRGCNVANWNMIENRRIKRLNGEVLINEEYPIVFVHFTQSTISGIISGQDGLLFPFLEQFAAQLTNQGGPDVIKKTKAKFKAKELERSLKKRIVSKIRRWLK